MQRIGNLFERMTSYENLSISFRLARRGCGNTEAVCRFFFHLERELLRLQEELRDGNYHPGGYHFFTIYDPKERVIAVAPFRDRVVHHAIVRVLTPVYEPVFIYDSYATRPGKGTHAAILRAQTFLRRWRFYLKTDVNKYFDSVDHNILLSFLRRKLKDRRLLDLLERIIRSVSIPVPEVRTGCPRPISGQDARAPKGLPIGNLTSQFLANVYLDPLDHIIKDQWGLKGYVRYMDDLVLFENSKHILLDLRPRLDELLEKRFALRLKPKATFLNKASHGLSFLGMRIFKQIIRVKPENRRRSLKRMQRKIQDWEAGRLDEERMQQSLVSIIGHLRYFSLA